jgi:hypothetical protein
VARILVEIEGSAHALLASDGQAAAALVEALDLRLQPVEAYVARLASLAGDPARLPAGAEAADVLALAGLAARQRALIGLYRGGGLGPARAALHDPARQRIAGAARAILLKGPDCGRLAAAAGEAGEGRGAPPGAAAALSGKPAAGAAPQMQPLHEDTSAPGRFSMRVGLIVAGALALALLVLGLSVRLDRREDPRHPCHLPTTLRIGGQEHPAVLSEISRGGAKLQVRGAFRPGERGEVVIDGAAYRVRVVWVNPNFLGLGFQRRLDFDPQELARRSVAVPTGAPAAGPTAAPPPPIGAWQPTPEIGRPRRLRRRMRIVPPG